MPPPRPRGFGNSSGISGRPSPSTPMSERQQMALLMQMTSASPSCSPDVHQSLNNLNQLASRSRDRNERGETSLHVAAIKGDQDGVKKLLESGVNPNVLDFAGWSPLHEACSHGYYNIAFSLIKAGANVNAKGLDDDTPLHDAAVIGNLKLVKLLIEKGADIFAKNRKGKTPTDVAASSISAYMCSLRDTSSHNNNKSAQASKKVVLSDLRRSSEGDDGSNPGTSESNEENSVVNLKKNFKDSLNIDDGKSQPRNKVEKSINQKDEFYNEDDTTNSFKLGNFNPNTTIKRAHSDVEVDESPDGDEIKKKKRKDSDSLKDTCKASPSTKAPTRNDKVSKQTVGSSKPSSVGLKMTSERKSPCVSPKPILVKAHDSDLETEETKVLESASGNGPKVPPLKIVIPQQNDPECGSRNGKVNSVRSQIAHPYVVSSSNSNDSLSAEKDTNPSRCSSPTEGIQKNNSGNSVSALLQEEKNVKLSIEEKGQQRILRSSHRTGGHNIDRSSNNSSPQLQSNSPSPATISEMNDKNLNLTNNPIGLQIQNQTLDTDSNGLVSNLSTISSPSLKDMQSNSVELHPRKRKIRTKHEESFVKGHSTSVGADSNNSYDIHPHDHPFTNCYHMYLNIRNQIEKKHRTLFPIQPRPPQGFAEYLMNRKSYLLANNHTPEFSPTTPSDLPPQMIDLFKAQERERYKLKMKHVVEKEKLGLTVEQEILRVHGKAARSLACQSVPFSVCTLLRDEEVYNLITPEQEEKDRNARSRYNGRLFISWLQDVDDKWEKIKEAMVLRHHNEAESLHALQRMGWDEGLKDNDLCDNKSKPYIQEEHVPIVHVSDDFELLPA